MATLRTERTRFIAVALGAVTFVACTSGPESRPRDQTCGRVVSPSAPKQPRPAAGTRAIYSSGRDLRLYDFSTDSLTFLRTGRDSPNGGSPNGLRPRFRDAHSVTFAEVREKPNDVRPFGQDSLYEFNLDDRRVTEILRLPADLRGYDWSPDGKLIAYQISTFSSTVSIALCLFDSVLGAVKLMRILGVNFGTSASQSDEQSVTWSPQGTSILVADSFERPALYVIDQKGRNLVPPWEGTFARWLPDGRKVLFRELGDVGRPGRWSTLDVNSGKTRAVGIPPGTFRPRISPDGQLIVYDDGDGEAPSTYLYDVARGTHRLLIRNYGAPVWLGARQVAATAGGPCPKGSECNDWWVPLNRTVGIDVVGGDKPKRLALQTTLQDVPLFSNIDVYLGPAG